MFNNKSDERGSDFENHEHNQQISHESENISDHNNRRVNPFNVRQIMKYLLTTLLLVILFQMMMNNHSNIVAICSSRLGSWMNGLFHQGDSYNDQEIPIFGQVQYDTEDSNPLNLPRLIIVILLCLSMLVPFLI